MKTDFDTAWKEALEQFLPFFMMICFPAIYAKIDWEAGFEFMDKELQELFRDSPGGGRKYVDKLFKARLWGSNSDVLVLFHIEVQHHEDSTFTLRIYQYHYRLEEKHGLPVVTLAILADANPAWEPKKHEWELLGCHVRFDFPICKLLTLKERREELEKMNSPAAFVILADWASRETAKDIEERFKQRLGLTRQLLLAGYEPGYIGKLYGIMSYLLWLPPEQEKEYEQAVRQLESESNMPPIMKYEQRLIDKGREEGLSQGREEGRHEGREEGRHEGREGLRRSILMALEVRFGVEPAEWEAKLSTIREFAKLQEVLKAAMLAASLDEFKRISGLKI